MHQAEAIMIYISNIINGPNSTPSPDQQYAVETKQSITKNFVRQFKR